MIKTLNKLELEIASPDKDYLQKPRAKIALNGKKFQTSTKVSYEARMASLTLCFAIMLKSLFMQLDKNRKAKAYGLTRKIRNCLCSQMTGSSM